MKEFGNQASKSAKLLCEVKECASNRHATVYDTRIVREVATGHELLKNHPAVVVYCDRAYPVNVDDALEILRLTGYRIPENLIGQS